MSEEIPIIDGDKKVWNSFSEGYNLALDDVLKITDTMAFKNTEIKILKSKIEGLKLT